MYAGTNTPIEPPERFEFSLYDFDNGIKGLNEELRIPTAEYSSVTVTANSELMPVNLSTRSFNTGTRQGTTPPYAKEKTHEDFVKEVAAGPTVHRL